MFVENLNGAKLLKLNTETYRYNIVIGENAYLKIIQSS